MSNNPSQIVFDELANCLDIPESAYDKAESRYQDLAEWFARKDSHCYAHNPHIYSQGSFRLGTVVKADEYDLDFGCRLQEGVYKRSHTQKQLKELVRVDLEAYRAARGIQQELDEKTRCWRLKYKDDLSFHMDCVPSIPEELAQRNQLKESMIKYGSDDFLAETVALHAGSITDNRMPSYGKISSDWRISNSEGFALWFESRMRLAEQLREKLAHEAKAAKIDRIPTYKWKSPLQRCVQILKCHRDKTFADNPDAKPISVILTTLAGKSYQGEQDVEMALKNILNRMNEHVHPSGIRIPNPVNPAEDFADKWSDPAYKKYNLEHNFNFWLSQARADFDLINGSNDIEHIREQAMSKYGAAINSAVLKSAFASSASPAITFQPKSHTITEAPARPWVN